MKIFIYKKIEFEEDARQLQGDITKINEWCNLWKLPLHLNKCNIMTFSLKKNKIEFEYKLSKPLERVQETKDLGILMNVKLDFGQHINSIVKNAFRMLGFLKRESFNLRNPFTVMSLYKTLIRSHLEYASVIWNPSKNVHISKIERVQRKFVKFYCYKFGITYSSDNYETIRKQLGLESTSERRMYSDLMLLHKIINYENDCPYLLEKLNIRVPTFFSRNVEFFYTPFSRVDARKNSPLIRSMDTFNKILEAEICPNIDFSTSLKTFRNTLRHTFSQA